MDSPTAARMQEGLTWKQGRVCMDQLPSHVQPVGHTTLWVTQP